MSAFTPLGKRKEYADSEMIKYWLAAVIIAAIAWAFIDLKSFSFLSFFAAAFFGSVGAGVVACGRPRSFGETIRVGVVAAVLSIAARLLLWLIFGSGFGSWREALTADAADFHWALWPVYFVLVFGYTAFACAAVVAPFCALLFTPLIWLIAPVRALFTMSNWEDDDSGGGGGGGRVGAAGAILAATMEGSSSSDRRPSRPLDESFTPPATTPRKVVLRDGEYIDPGDPTRIRRSDGSTVRNIRPDGSSVDGDGNYTGRLGSDGEFR